MCYVVPSIAEMMCCVARLTAEMMCRVVPSTAEMMPCVQASYGVEDPEYAITQLAQTTMRSEIGKIALDTVFRERESLNINIVGETE